MKDHFGRMISSGFPSTLEQDCDRLEYPNYIIIMLITRFPCWALTVATASAWHLLSACGLSNATPGTTPSAGLNTCTAYLKLWKDLEANYTSSPATQLRINGVASMSACTSRKQAGCCQVLAGVVPGIKNKKAFTAIQLLSTVLMKRLHGLWCTGFYCSHLQAPHSHLRLPPTLIIMKYQHCLSVPVQHADQHCSVAGIVTNFNKIRFYRTFHLFLKMQFYVYDCAIVVG